MPRRPILADTNTRLFADLDVAEQKRPRRNGELNKLQDADRPVHNWYRFVLSFPPHLVRDYIDKLGLAQSQVVLDPFCGTGTTLVECKKIGIPSVGVEAHPMAHFASQVKVDWSPDPVGIIQHASTVAEHAAEMLAVEGIGDAPRRVRKTGHSILRTLPDESMRLLLANSISPLPLHKVLVLLDCLETHREDSYHAHELLALAKTLVTTAGNLHFGPEVGVAPPKADAPVISTWLAELESMARDLVLVRDRADISTIVHHADSRQIATVITADSVSAVFTSPPYPNEKDYTRTTRLESVLLGFVRNREDLRVLKAGLVRSNTRNVYKGDDDDSWIAAHPEIARIAEAIENRRRKMGKTSGFERLYPRVTKLYFGGMAKHLAGLRRILRPNAWLAYVVGDQASYLRVMIRTGQILAEIAKSLGYKVEGIDLFRTRLATATREQLREEVLVLRWPG